MSRIGKQPVVIPAGVKVQVGEGKVRVEGPKGKLELAPHPAMKVELDDKAKVVRVSRPDDERQNRALHGLTRNLIKNMVEGVTKGYERRLKIEGVGYQAALDSAGQAALEADILALLERTNRGGTETLIAPSEYLEVVITRS